MNGFSVLLDALRGPGEDTQDGDQAEGETAQAAAVADPETGEAGDSGVLAAWNYALTAGRARWKAAVDKDGGLVNHLIRSKQPSVFEQQTYARNRTWVKPGHEGGMLDRAGSRYQKWIGTPWVAFANLNGGLAKRAVRGLLAWFFVTALVTACLMAVFRPEALWILLGAAGGWTALLAALFV